MFPNESLQPPKAGDPSPDSVTSVTPMTGLVSNPSSVYIITSDGRTLKLPIPSCSPRDPLTWSLAKRSLAFTSLAIFSTVIMIQLQGSGLITTRMYTEYENKDIRPFSIPILACADSLFIGLGAFFWVPLSLAIGRRPVFLMCNVFSILGTFGAAVSQNYYQHLLAICCQGFAMSIMPSLIVLIIIDLTFISERAIYISLFYTIVAVVAQCLLAVTPHIIKACNSWRAFNWIGLGPSIFSLAFALFFFPETYFRRPPIAFDGRVLTQSSEEKINIYSSWSEIEESKTLPDLPTTRCRLKLREMKVWNTAKNDTSWKAMGYTYPQILLAFFNPIILWVMLLKALFLGCLVAFSMTGPLLLTLPPYNVRSENVGVLFLAGAVGSVLAYPLAGPMMNRISRGLAVRNGGTQNPEHYLVGFIIPVLLGFAGQLLYGFAGQNFWPIWTIYLSFAMFILGFAALYTATALWATIAFPRWAAASITVVSGGSYMISIGFSFTITRWIQREGFAKANAELAVSLLVVGLCGIPIAIWGRRFRGYVEGKVGVSGAGALRPY